ncbi:MAG: NAD-glutamate dehydrogenase, partial [Beijerinckiaceae bacterium]
MSRNKLATSALESLLFSRVALEDLDRVSPEARQALAERALAHLATRRPGMASVSVLEGSTAGLPDAMILEAINDDSPFLLDSALAELNERGLTPRLVAHPILVVEREPSGALSSPPELAVPGKKGTRESLIHIHLPRLSPSETAELTAALEVVFDNVRQAVADFEPMRKRLKSAAKGYRKTPPPLSKAGIEEAIAFLEWAAADHMTLLGMREYRLQKGDENPIAVVDSGLGILRDPNVHVLRRGRNALAMTPEILTFLREQQALIITKANVKSLVHRRVHMDYLGIKLYDSDGKVSGELRVVGLLTATAYNDPVSSIPYLSRKAGKVLKKAGLPADSHSSRALVNVLESYPRDELFQISQEQLNGFAIDILALGDRPRLRALPRVDRFDRFVSILVYVPKDRYDSEVRRKIGLWLAGQYNGRLSAAYPHYPDGPLTRTHFIIGRDEGPTPHISRDDLEAGIAAIVRTWSDDLRDAALTIAGA